MSKTKSLVLERLDYEASIGEMRAINGELKSWLVVKPHTLISSVISVALVGKGMWGHDDIANRAGEFRKSVGVYFLVKGSCVVYVGQSTNVLARIAQHAKDGKDFDRACYIPCSESELDVVESLYIWSLRPVLNHHAPITFKKLVERLASSEFVPMGASPGSRPERIVEVLQALMEDAA